MEQAEVTPQQAKLLKMTLLERLPIALVGVPIKIQHRAKLTTNAVGRGKQAAAIIAPIMRRQSAALVEVEDIFGQARINGFAAQCESAAMAAEAHVAQIREAVAARV